jgi:hypothetical protein
MTEWSVEEVNILLQMYPEYATAKVPVYLLAKVLPLRSADAIEKKARVLRSQGLLKPYKDYAATIEGDELEKFDQVTVTREKGMTIIESPRGKRIKSVDDLVEACGIDLKKQIIERELINKWEVGTKNEDGEIVVEPLFQVKVWLKPRLDLIALELGREKILEDIRRVAPVYPPLPPMEISDGYLFEPAIFDVHLGRHSWGKETGAGDWDMSIAQEVYNWAMDDLISSVQDYPIAKVLLPIGQDFFHVDNAKGQTSAGTQVDHDGRWQKMFMAGYDSTRRAIDRLLQETQAPIQVVVISGNHDEELAFCLGALIEAWYSNTAEVEVDNSPLKRKYFQWGNNMICFTHGRFEKHDVLPMIMAGEAPEMWGSTLFREIHVGDLHYRKHTKYTPFRDVGGVGLRILPSLAEPDAWHAERGYTTSLRSAEAYLWDMENGLAATFHANRPFSA